MPIFRGDNAHGSDRTGCRPICNGGKSGIVEAIWDSELVAPVFWYLGLLVRGIAPSTDEGEDVQSDEAKEGQESFRSIDPRNE